MTAIRKIKATKELDDYVRRFIGSCPGLSRAIPLSKWRGTCWALAPADIEPEKLLRYLSGGVMRRADLFAAVDELFPELNNGAGLVFEDALATESDLAYHPPTTAPYRFVDDVYYLFDTTRGSLGDILNNGFGEMTSEQCVAYVVSNKQIPLERHADLATLAETLVLALVWIFDGESLAVFEFAQDQQAAEPA